MVRDVAILGAAMLAFQVACPQAQSAPLTAADVHHARHKAISPQKASAAPQKGPPKAVAVQKAAARPKAIAPVHTAGPAPQHTAAAIKKIVRSVAAYSTAQPTPVVATYQVPTPEVDTANGAPTPLAFHVGPGGEGRGELNLKLKFTKNTVSY